MKVKIALVVLLITVIVRGGSAQNENRLPAFDFTPQSPSAAAFSKYGDIPVDLSTGVPKIQIPLYTLTSGPISVPLSISYHASGIKVREIASEVGLGWVLNVGGVLTRTILGVQDEYQPLYGKTQPNDSTSLAQDIQNAYATQTWNGKSLEIFNSIRFRGTQDAYSDRYYYSLGNGESGIFRKNFVNDSLMMIPYSPTRAEINADGITLTTTDGNRYFFKKNFRDLWYLTKIVSHNKTDSVLFYSHRETIAVINTSHTAYHGGVEAYMKEISDVMSPCSASIDTKPGDLRKEVFVSHFTETDDVVIFDSIVSSSAVVKFIYLQDRQDRSFLEMTKSRIKEIQIISRTSREPVKKFSFFHSYFGANASEKRLRLDSLRIGITAGEKYAFRYNTMPLPEYPDSRITQANQNGYYPYFLEDYWGYYNGMSSQSTIPRTFFVDGAIKVPDEYFAKACMLEEIHYPTGGYTVFEFEGNKVISQSGITAPDGKTGGLRVKRIRDYESNHASPIVRTYEYSIPNAPTSYSHEGLFNYRENRFTSYSEELGGLSCRGSVFSWANVAVSYPFSPLFGDSRLPVIYGTVTEYLGDENKNIGKTIYMFNEPQASPMIDFEIVDSDSRFLNAYQFDRGIYKSRLLQKQEYKYESEIYKIVRETVNSYTPHKVRKIQTGFNLASALVFSAFRYPVGIPPDDDWSGFTYYLNVTIEYLNTLLYSNTWGYTTNEQLTQTEVWDYTNADAVVKTITSYKYNQYLQLARKTLSASDGNDLITEYKYVPDFKITEPYATLVARNFLQAVVEQSDYKNETSLEMTRTNYNGQWGNNIIAPETVEHQVGTDPIMIRSRFHAYDAKGNPITVSKENDHKKSYIWGYNKTYPIAEVVNADTEQIAYSSFEQPQEESWTVNGNYLAVVDLSSPTGKKCYNLTLLCHNNFTENQADSYICASEKK